MSTTELPETDFSTQAMGTPRYTAPNLLAKWHPKDTKDTKFKGTKFCRKLNHNRRVGIADRGEIVPIH